jgi:hypothetical protein
VFSRDIVLRGKGCPRIPARRRGIGDHSYRHGSATRSRGRAAAAGDSRSASRSAAFAHRHLERLAREPHDLGPRLDGTVRVRGGSFSRQTCRLAILAPRLDHPIKGPALGAFIAQNGRGGDNADRRRSVRSVSGAMMLEGPPSTIHQSADSQPNTVVRSAARRSGSRPER